MTTSNIKLGDVITISKGKAITKKDSTPGPYPVILGGKEPAYFIDKFNHSGKAIVISRSGASAGYVSYWNEPIFVTDGFIINPNDFDDFDFIYYQLKFKQSELLLSQRGSAIPHVTPKLINDITISYPTKPIRNKITLILSKFDKLISINRRRIAILEEMAMRTYQEWFVHFRFPGHETTEFINGLPAGWEICKLEDLAYESGKPEKKQNRDQYKYYLPIDCLPRKSLTYSSTDVIENAESSLLSFDKYDILFGAMRPYFHKVVFARDKGLTRSTCFVLNAKDKDMWGYLLMLLFDERTIDFATQICTGSTMPYVLWDTLGRMDCIKPSKEVAKLYLNYIKTIIKELTNLISQNSDLQQMRDRLLPQLMSGQLEITTNEEAL